MLLVEGIAPEPPAGLPAARLVSRFLGLFLSSNRLPINQRRDLASVSDLDPPSAWRRIRHELRQAVTDPVWSIWLEPLSARSLDGDCHTLGVFRPRQESFL